MRKGKKWTATVLSLMLLGTLNACQKEPAESTGAGKGTITSEDTSGEKELDPMELYTQASEKTNSLQDMEMSINMDMKIMQGEEHLDMTSKTDMKITGNGTDAMEYHADSLTTFMGQEISSTMFYKEGYYYMDTMGQKYKYAYDAERLMEQIKGSIGASAPEMSGIQNIKAEKKNGNTLLTFDVDPSQMNTYVANALGTLADTDLIGSMEIRKVTGTCTVGADGYFTNSDIHMNLSTDIQGTAIDVEANAVSSILRTGDPVTITYPEDLNRYTEIDTSLADPES